ncbi:MAG: hypothetical protein ABEH58_09860 [Haloplanus sp.]
MVEPLVGMHADEAYLLVNEGPEADAVVDRLSAEGIDIAIEYVDLGSVTRYWGSWRRSPIGRVRTIRRG